MAGQPVFHVWTYLETIPGARDNLLGTAPYPAYLTKRKLDEVLNDAREKLRGVKKMPFPTDTKSYRKFQNVLYKIGRQLQDEYYEFDRWFGQQNERTEVPEELVKKKIDKLFQYVEIWTARVKERYIQNSKKEERTLDLFIEHFEGTDERGVWIKRSRLYEYYHEWMKGSEKNLTTNLKLKAKLCERIGQTHEVVKKGKKVIVPKDCKVRGHYVFKCTTKFKDLE